jgi:hypothetical protein
MNHGIRTLALAGALAAGMPLAAQAAASGDATQYHIGDILVGSVLPQEIVTGPVPFDSPYAALTSAQKAVLSNDYENLSAGDEPPFPLYGIRHMIKPLIPFAETWNSEGPLIASAEVDSWGNAVAVTVYRSPDPQVTRLVSGAMTFEKYKPASCSGRPCSMQYVLRLNFPGRNALPVTTIALHPYDGVPGQLMRR